MLGIPAFAVLGVYWYAVVAFDGESRLIRIGLLGLAESVILAILLIPSGGANGAAWTYVASVYAMAGLTLFVLERQLLGRSEPAAATAGLELGGPDAAGSEDLPTA